MAGNPKTSEARREESRNRPNPYFSRTTNRSKSLSLTYQYRSSWSGNRGIFGWFEPCKCWSPSRIPLIARRFLIHPAHAGFLRSSYLWSPPTYLHTHTRLQETKGAFGPKNVLQILLITKMIKATVGNTTVWILEPFLFPISQSPQVPIPIPYVGMGRPKLTS